MKYVNEIIKSVSDNTMFYFNPTWMNFSKLLFSIIYWHLNTSVSVFISLFSHCTFSFLISHDISLKRWVSSFFFSLNYWLGAVRKKFTMLDSLNADSKIRNAHVVNVIARASRFNNLYGLKNLLIFSPRLVHCVTSRKFHRKVDIIAWRGGPHATLSVLIYKRIIDVTQFTWQYRRNCRKNVTITWNLRYRLPVLVALCCNFHLSSSRLLFFMPHAIFAIILLHTYFTDMMDVQNVCLFISAFPD